MAGLGMASTALYLFHSATRQVRPLGFMAFAWIVGTLVFVAFVNHLVNVRTLLPLAPVFAILAAQGLTSSIQQRWAWGFAATGGSLALLIGAADAGRPNYAREVVQEAVAEARSAMDETNQVYFVGHWGMQYYLEELGAKPIDLENTKLRRGDFVLLPENNTNLVRFPGAIIGESREWSRAAFPFVTTMHKEAMAGFHADVWGSLPYAFGPAPLERYALVRIDLPEGMALSLRDGTLSPG